MAIITVNVKALNGFWGGRMPSRRDQLHSHQFMVQRVVSALVMRETDPVQSPFRRVTGATLASMLVTVVIMAGFGVYSVFTGGGSTQWQQDGYVVIEKETGATFLYRGSRPNGKLHPVLNYTSALLASGGAGKVAKNVPSRSLQGIPRGFTIGVMALPDSLPAANDGLVGMPWSACTVPARDASPASVLAVGDPAIASAGRTLTESQAILVQAGRSESFLLSRGKLHSISSEIAGVLIRSTAPAIAVATAFVNATPRGQAFTLPRIDDFGQPSAFARNANRSWLNGQVFELVDQTDAANRQWAVVQPDRIERITALQAKVMLARTNEIGGFTRHRESAVESEFGAATRDVRPRRDDPSQPPAETPEFVTPSSGICSVYKDDGGEVEIRHDIPLDLTGRVRTQRRSPAGAVYADVIIVPTAKGALVQTGQTFCLVTDLGMRYQAAKREVLSMLGYGGKPWVTLPPEVVGLIPEGPGLDPDRVLFEHTS